MTSVPARADRPPGRLLVVVSYAWDPEHRTRGLNAESSNALYWANIAVQAATLRHVAGATAEFVVCSTGPSPPDPGHVLDGAGGEIRQIAFAHRPPPTFHDVYGASLYLWDTMPALADDVDDDDVVFFVDPDILWARSPDPLAEEARAGGVVGYDLAVPEDAPVVDRSRREIADITRQMLSGARQVSGVPTYFGGEFYGMTGLELRAVVKEIEPLWTETLARFRRGEPYFHVEEHLMNALLWLRGETSGRANPYLQRIRTLPPPFGTRERYDESLVAWHLPYEKDRAMPRLLRHLLAGREMPEAGPSFEAWLRRRAGIESVGGRRLADAARTIKWRIAGPRPDERTPLGL